MAKLGTKELTLLRLIIHPVERSWLNAVVLTKAINDGYAEVYGVSMIRITDAGLSRLDQLHD